MLYVAQQIPEKDVEKLKQYFLKVDLNGNGTLTLEEMQAGNYFDYKPVLNNLM